jgi:tryptophan-rich sensory protein
MASGKEQAAAAPVSPWIGLVLAFGATAMAAAVGSAASIRAAGFYAELAKPAWAPPAGVFGPVWTALYFLMAVAAWMVWRRAGPAVAKGPLLLYLAQLALNALWTWVFFRWRSGGWALAEILFLWLVLLFMIVGFWRVRVAAGVLLLPYWAWVTFAAALTAAIWRLNPGAL